MSYKTSKIRKLVADFESFQENLQTVIDEGGQYKDTAYKFSNISMLIRNIAYVAQLMDYGINAVCAESLLNTAKTYKSTNILSEKYGYSPTGFQSASAGVDVSLMFSNYSDNEGDWYNGSYLKIPKYTKFETLATTPYMNEARSRERIFYSTVEDWFFPLTDDYSNLQTTTSGDGRVVSGAYWPFEREMETYNGVHETEYYSSSGDGYEMITLNNANYTKIVGNVPVTGRHKIDYRYIDVYVKNSYTGDFEQWTRVDSLSDRQPVDKIYEVRVNGDLNYEIRFGDGVNGVIPTAGVDTIKVVYLVSNMDYGEVGSGVLVPHSNFFVVSDSYVRCFNHKNNQLQSVSAESSWWSSASGTIDDVILQNNNRFIADDEVEYDIKIEQVDASSQSVNAEDLVAVKSNTISPARWSGLRLGNTDAYVNFAKNQLDVYVHDAYAMNNIEFMNGMMAEMITTEGYGQSRETISGVQNPLLKYKTQIDSTFFNNVYVFIVPQDETELIHPNKEKVLKAFYDNRMSCTNSIVLSPIYANLGFYIDLVRDDKYKQSKDVIRQNIRNYLEAKFLKEVSVLGMDINIEDMKAEIIETVPGIASINTILVFQKDYFNFTDENIDEILSDPFGYEEVAPITKQNYDYSLPGYKFPDLNSDFTNDIRSIKIRDVGEDNLPYVEVV